MPGRTLRAVLEEGPFPEDQCRSIVLDVTEGHPTGVDRPTMFTGNLAARNWRDDAGCRLADTVLRAADALGAQRDPYGACSDDGDVVLGDR